MGGKHRLPPDIHVLIFDPETGERFGIYAKVTYFNTDESSPFEVDWHPHGIGILKKEVSTQEKAEHLADNCPETALVCDEEILRQIIPGSVSWIDEGHYRLQGIGNGMLEVYTPYKALNVPKDMLPVKLPPGTTVILYQE